MRTEQPLLLLSTLLLYLVTFTAAWPWPVDKIFPVVDSLIVRDAFVRRADSSSSATPTSAASSAAKTTASDSSASESGSKTTDSASASGSGSGSSASGSGTASDSSGTASDSSNTGSITGSATSDKSTSKKISSSTSSISVASDAAAGGLEMLIPDTTSGSSFYKISDYVTFAWNYTSLSITPTAIDVLVTCTSNSQMYTIAHNMSVSDNATGAVTWDTNDYPEKTSAPLLTAIYTLYIFDADSSISADASAGHLSAASLAFGMYTKSPYTPLSEWTCAACSGALSADERRYLGFLLGMVGVTVLSFTWFVSGLGVVW